LRNAVLIYREVCGGIYVNEPCVIDRHMVSGRTYHDSGHFVGPWIITDASGKITLIPWSVIPRRSFLKTLGSLALAPALMAKPAFEFRYTLAWALYGEMPLDRFCPRWPKLDRQLMFGVASMESARTNEQMGDDAFAALANIRFR